MASEGITHHSTGRCAIKPRSAGEFKRSPDRRRSCERVGGEPRWLRPPAAVEPADGTDGPAGHGSPVDPLGSPNIFADLRMAWVQTFLSRLCCLTLAVIFAVVAFTRKSGDWPATIFGVVLSGLCLLVFTFDAFGARLRKQFPFLSRFRVKPLRLVVNDERTEVYYADGKIVFSLANQIVWRPEVKGGQVIAVGAPDEWLSSSPRVLPADAVQIDLVAEVFAATPRIDELWEAFFCYCIEVSRRKVGFWKWFGRQFFSPLKVDLRIRDEIKSEFVGAVLRRCKFIGPVDVYVSADP